MAAGSPLERFDMLEAVEGSIFFPPSLQMTEDGMPYTAFLFANPENTVIYAQINAANNFGGDSSSSALFMSRNAAGVKIYTIPALGPMTKDVPQKDPMIRVRMADGNSDAAFREHLRHVGDEAAPMDREWIKTEARTLPQLSIDLLGPELETLSGMINSAIADSFGDTGDLLDI